ncbi:FMN-dependent NADH-azoreductase [Mycoplasma buteonis]|uniref:FMN-dependent NADH-azoreductase n=1 Tax=Mycoplasma buteonis TaxID=171280 RepID=UPI00055C4E00|nr:FMN-dependent NADH-azoreductase [Mycoplasma buteonis]
MKKIVFLDGNVVSDANSFSHHLMDSFHQVATADTNNQVLRFNLNETEHSKVFLNANTLKTYFQDVNSDKWINLLKETDVLVLSSSMINFGPSVVVKNFLDSICVADKTFSYKYSKKGDAIGLLTNLKVVLVTSQGAPLGWYPFNNNETWLKGVFEFLGAQVYHIGTYGTKVEPLKSQGTSKASEEQVKLFLSFINENK